MSIRDLAATDAVYDDAYLDLALEGTHLIEASAGTGKTFTLATLVTRLLVERGLSLRQILAVTFTEAATQELRARLRTRLNLAADIASALAADPDHAAGDDAEAVLTHAIIRRQLQHEDAGQLRSRLLNAVREVDLAAVFTIHGFCARVLAEHALHSGSTFDPPELVGSERALREDIAADLWRAHGADPVDAELLHRLWKQPADLASDLRDLLGRAPLLPPPPEATPDPMPQLQRAADNVRAAFAEHGDDLLDQLEAAIAGKALNGNSYRSNLTASLWPALQSWCAAGEPTDQVHSHVDRLLPSTLAAKTNKGKEAVTPASPVCDAVAGLLDAQSERDRWLAARSLDLLHRIRSEGRARLAHLKRTLRLQTYDDLIAGVAVALAGPQGDALVAALRAQYAVALVDEFQDTDARQWAIFRRIFGAATEDDGNAMPAPGLFLIGDPKQAIYGFRGGDVHVYLAARRDAAQAPPLSQNFRSRPSVLRAIEALYGQAGDKAFVDSRIEFLAVDPGAGMADADYQRSGEPAPGLTLRTLPPPGDDRKSPVWSVSESRQAATTACVAEIHAVLSESRAGDSSIRGKPVQPGDLAVLVRSHKEAAQIQQALVAAGIPAVAAGKQSLFETEQARELLAVFEALLQPADEGRLRAALATVLLGVDGAGIDRMDSDGELRRRYQLDALRWRERWQRHGPFALVVELCAANATRLLGLGDGERRLTNLLQLGELLQEADARALGAHGLVDWLRGQIAAADRDDEQQLLRLESDARRVQILTLHKSKGLEFPLVFLPFVGIGRKKESPARSCLVPDEDGGVLHWRAGREQDAQDWVAAVEAWEIEQRAEDARLLYVGLTRARQSLWLAHGPLFNAGTTALAAMLADPRALHEHGDIRVDAGLLETVLPSLPPESVVTVGPAREAQRFLSRDWWVYSFTQLSQADSGDDAGIRSSSAAVERASDDERATAIAVDSTPAVALERQDQEIDRRFIGSRFGNVLHDALERSDFNAWCDWRGGSAPTSQAVVLRDALCAAGYADADLNDGCAHLANLVGQTLTVGLPEGILLCDLPEAARRAEMEFHFSLRPTSVEALLDTLHAHGVLRDRHGFGARRKLEGLMTGKIDLTYRAGDRYYLLDYKSNRLPGYDADHLAQAMAHSEYDLQALIYTVALHRWLRFRLGDGYDYNRDFGGVRYLFCRGLDAAGGDGSGIHANTPSFALVDALDALFAGGRP